MTWSCSFDILSHACVPAIAVCSGFPSIMNWTEGNLNRHSRARKGKETLLRQKEHFAKARAGILDANVKISPPSVSFLAIPAQHPSSVRRDALKSTSSRKHQSDDRLMSSRYFSEDRPKLPASTRLQGQETEDEAMRQKRRKLLLKGDWVGTNVQKPIEMEFTKPRGSPSNPWGVKKSRRQASKQKLRRLLGVKHGEEYDRAGLGAVDASTPASLRRIKVRVGGYERALGDSSNASPRSNGTQVQFSGSRGKSFSRRKIPLRSVRELTEQCPVGRRRYRDLREQRQDRGQACIPRSDASHRSHSSASQTPLLTTSPLLFHPVPTRPALLHLLHPQSVDSDNANSTLAQLGVDHPPVPSSQASENDVWRTFVACPNDDSAFNEMRSSDNPEDAAQRPVSPGVSQLGTSRPLHGTYNTEAAVSPETREVNNIAGDRAPPTASASRFAEELRPDPCHHRSSEVSSDDDQIAPIATDDITSRGGSDLSQPSESTRGNDRRGDGSSKELAMPAGSSDEMSLLVVSSSPRHPPLLGEMDEATTFLMDQPEGITFRSDASSPRLISPQLLGKDPAFKGEAAAAIEEQLPGELTQEDENDMWRNFVFGDSSGILEKALEDARRDTARSLRPSLPSTSTCSCEESPQGLTASSLDHVSIDRRDFAEELYETTRKAASTTSASHVATAGASSADLSSDTTSGSVEIALRTDQATHGSCSPSSAASNNMCRQVFPNELMTSSTCEADTSTSTIDPKQLEKHGESDDCFKFARPKLFVGKKIEHVDEQRQIALSAPQIRGKPQARRRQKRTTDGRANIRKLPNYGGSDPIEEFELDYRSDRADKGSMFGPLETESGF